MKKKSLIIFIFISFIFSQKIKYNIKDIVELNGVFYKNFSNEKVSGFIFKEDNEINIPLGMIKNGKKQGQWLEWSERKDYQENLELDDLEKGIDQTDTVDQITIKKVMSREINEYISGDNKGQIIMVLVSSQVINYDKNGTKVEESNSYYNSKGFLKDRIYRRFEYDLNEKYQKEKIRVYNNQNYLIETENLRYNEKDNLIEQIIQEPGGTIIGKVFNDYDIYGKLIEHIRYGQDGRKLRSIKNFYDQNGKKIVEKNIEFLINSDESRKINKKFTYDRKGNLIRIDDKYFRTYYFYDDYNNLEETKTFLVDSSNPSVQEIIVAKTVYRFSFY